MNKKTYNQLPLEIQTQIKNTLRAYNEVNVIFEYGKYNVSTGISLKKKYAIDHEFIGTYYKDEIYNADEKIINYIEEFISYPIQYKGKKDWNMIKELENLRGNGKQAKIKLIEGNAVIDKIINIEN